MSLLKVARETETERQQREIRKRRKEEGDREERTDLGEEWREKRITVKGTKAYLFR